MPEGVKNRCTKAHEYIFLLAKSQKYYFDSDAIKEPSKNANKRVSLGPKSFSRGQAAGLGVSPSGNALADFYIVPEYRNKRSVWTITTKPFAGAHFATFPPDLIQPCILAGCPKGGTVLDPFGGSGTTAGVALAHGRKAILCELNPDYAALVESRVYKVREGIDKVRKRIDHANDNNENSARKIPQTIFKAA
jgi:DNA modification methylase